MDSADTYWILNSTDGQQQTPSAGPGVILLCHPTQAKPVISVQESRNTVVIDKV